jgi:deoxycytidine triphosphate deaminase
MSVVPLKLGESVVDTEDAFQAASGFEGNALLIFNLDKPQLSSTSSNVSYDLRVGNEYRGHRDAEKTELTEGGELVLRPGNAVLIQSEEVVFLPRKLFGYVVPKVSLLQQGVTNTLSKIDPGYNGPLIVTLFNLGKVDLHLKRRDHFCSIVLHTVADGAALYNKPGKRITGNPREPWWPAVKNWIEANKTWLTLAVGALSGGLAGAILTAIIMFSLRPSGGPAH